ncbi:Uncharacterized damage-inducible protein DinB (forms a four-helix bundle) [Lentibacillus halodurans]|uniref:Uncharacterized damage-inducible protein DinB (Forms a four-helix bundle) n=1 Tax=Lentibacillus halodurans TaxID=237679 RepID=A0A1I0X371_9BACI|nr:DinB family protein [Lentibacillus halodurans]SFA95097.1 Uncharacterized damage-inducible protein DinB (forms a four-helix bundle) [Lentibacillus halodurans]
MSVLKRQYDLVKSTRELLFAFCEKLDPEDYAKELDGFGWGSIRNLHIHVAECYQSWLANFGLKANVRVGEPWMVKSVQDMRNIFSEVDSLVYRFLDTYDGQLDKNVKGPVSWQEEDEELSVLWLFTHTITHEFHHKGQMVSMARQLGYVPDDTDLIVPGV